MRNPKRPPSKFEEIYPYISKSLSNLPGGRLGFLTNSAATVATATAAAAAAAGSTHVHVQVALRVPVPPQDLSKSNSRPRIGTGAGTGISSACRYATTAAMYGIRYGIQLCSTAEHYSVH